MAGTETFHVVSYYSLEDVHAGRLVRPKDSPLFTETKPCSELLTAMENTSLGSRGKPYMVTNSNSSVTSSDSSPLVPGAPAKMTYVDQHGLDSGLVSGSSTNAATTTAAFNNNNNNTTAGSMGEGRPEAQPRQPLQPWQTMQPLPGLRIPSLTSMYKQEEHQQHFNPHINHHLNQLQPELPPHSKFNRYGAPPVPLLNPYLQNKFLVPQPSNFRYINFPGYTYYNPTGGAFYPLPATGTAATVASTATPSQNYSNEPSSPTKEKAAANAPADATD